MTLRYRNGYTRQRRAYMNRQARALLTRSSSVWAMRGVCFSGFALFVFLLRGYAQNDWPDVGHDHQAQRYSPLKQINVQNVSRLAPVWRYRLAHEGDGNGRRAVQFVPL